MWRQEEDHASNGLARYQSEAPAPVGPLRGRLWSVGPIASPVLKFSHAPTPRPNLRRASRMGL